MKRCNFAKTIWKALPAAVAAVIFAAALAGFLPAGAGRVAACAQGTPQKSATRQKKKPEIEKMLQNEVTATAVLGTENRYFEDHLNTLTISVNNGRDAAFDGEIAVRIGRTPYRIVNVTAGPQSVKKYVLCVNIPRYSSPVRISLIDSRQNKVIYEDSVQITPNTGSNYCVLVVSESNSFFNEIKNQKMDRKVNYSKKKNYEDTAADSEVDITALTPQELFRYSECYQPYSLVILNGSDVSTLTKGQEQAIINYVREGGSLLVSYGGFASRISSSGLAEVLPVRITGSVAVDGSEFYRAAGMKAYGEDELARFANISVPLSVSEPLDDATIIIDYQSGGKNFPLIAQKRFGRGISYFTAFDISQTDISRIKYIGDNVKWLMKYSNRNEAVSVKFVAEYVNDFMSSYSGGEIKAPEPEGVISILFFFSLFVCLGIYFLARRNNSLGMIFLATLGASAAAFASLGYSEVESVMNQATVYELGFHIVDNADARVRAVTAVSVMEPPLCRGKYVVDSSASSFYNQNNSYDSGDNDIFIDDDYFNLVGPKMGYSFSKYVLSRSFPLNGKFELKYSAAPAPQSHEAAEDPAKLLKEFQKAADKKRKRRGAKQPGGGGVITGITNNTDLEIEAACIIYGDDYYETGKFYPGTTLEPSKLNEAWQQDKVISFIDNAMTTFSARADGTAAVGRPRSSNYNYRSRDFLDALTGRILSLKSTPVMIGFVKNTPSFSQVHAVSQCNRRESGSLIFVILK